MEKKQIIISSIISSLAIITALIHIIFPLIIIDTIILVLIGIAVVPWLGQLFKSLKFPGGFEVVFQELEKAKEKVERAGLLARETGTKRIPKYSFQSLAEEDPKLALAGLRIELEKSLRNIAESKGIPSERKGFGQLLTDLSQKGFLKDEEKSALSDLVSSLNKAVHGFAVDNNTAQWAMDFGPRILEGLESRFYKK